MKNFHNNDEAQVGIGTMIVFIATILIAAVAAGVLIDTSQTLQDKSTNPGNEATTNVGTSVEILTIYGERDQLDHAGAGTTTEGLDLLRIQIRSAAGAEPLDLSTLKIEYRDGSFGNFQTYEEGDAALNLGEFTVSTLVGTADDVLEPGEIVELVIGHKDTDNAGDDLELGIAAQTSVDLYFLPESGQDVSVNIVTPVSFGTKNIFELA